MPFPETELLRFINENNIKVLNVAGPRASKEPNVAAFVTEVLDGYHDASLLSQPAKREDCWSETERLVLRSFILKDAPALACLAGGSEIADTAFYILHPYTQQNARDWIARARDGGNNELSWAVCMKGYPVYIGVTFNRRAKCQKRSHH